MTSFALQLILHPLYHTKPEYLRCHIHFRHENKTPVSDTAPNVSISSDRLHWHLIHFCMTSHPPSGWHHMNYIEHHTQSLCQSHYCAYDITVSIYETTSSMRATYTLNMWHHSHSLGHDIYCIGNITPTLFKTLHSPYVWHRVHYTRYHILTFWPQTTLLGTSHPLY